MKLRATGIALLVGALLLIGTPIIQCGKLAFFAYMPKDRNGQELIIEVTPGQSPAVLAENLASNGIIRDSKTFIFLGRLTRKWAKIKVGEYRVSAAMTPMEIFAVVTSGISVAYRVTVMEGKNLFQIADILENLKLAKREEIIALCRDQTFIKSLGFTDSNIPTLEGYLFPETYFFNRSMGAKEMLKQMVSRFMANWTEEMESKAKALGFSRHQVVTLASIIEKETGAPEERPLISSVFHNRLKKRMRLQSDPTTIYGIWETFNGNLKRTDLQKATDYNTYRISGLPVGPIANPGREALAAALAPAKSDYLFFVSRNDGTHVFTTTLSDHENAVKRFQLDPSARSGKSWRDLNKGKTL